MKLTTASKITILRVLLIPVVIVLMYLDFEWHMYCALAVFVIASASDFVDGYIARHCNQVSNFGKFLDPLADKLLVISVMLVFVDTGLFPDVYKRQLYNNAAWHALSVQIGGQTWEFDTEAIEYAGPGLDTNELSTAQIELSGTSLPATATVTWHFQGSYVGTELENVVATGTIS